MKKTKIICSIGPSSSGADIMEQMARVGMDVARINCSHASVEEKQKVVETVKLIRQKVNKNIAILYDLKGPEFRNGVLENDQVNLVNGATIRIVKENVVGNETRFSVNHPQVLDHLNVGNTIFLENGLMKIEVISKESDGVTCRVISGGVLGSRKSLSCPEIKLDIPYVSTQDREDTIHACTHDADYLALSFVTCRQDILDIKSILKEQGREDLKLICKIENGDGVENLAEILDESEGIMVARGDLGTEVNMETIPLIQKQMIKSARELGKIAIVATEMLESMKNSARPTRAEISDVANAVLDGTDAVMLSGESTVGKYPVETVKIMADICLATEKHADYYKLFKYTQKIGVTQTIANAVVNSTDMLKAKLIVAATESGFTARKISNLKPKPLILACCPNEKVGRGLALNYGVYPVVIAEQNTVDGVLEASSRAARTFTNLESGDIIIITGGFPTGISKNTNLMKIETI